MYTRMLPAAALLLSFAFLLAACVTPPEARYAPSNAPIQVKTPQAVRPVAFTRVVAAIRRGEEIGRLSGGLLCGRGPALKWSGSKESEEMFDDLSEIFKTEFESAGWPVVTSEHSLFEEHPDFSAAEFLIAAKIQELQLDLCYPYKGLGNWDDAKGSAYIKTEWQVYSPARKKVLRTFTTSGAADTVEVMPEAGDTLMNDAFAQCVRNLLAKEEFLALATRPETTGEEGAAPAVDVHLANPAYRYEKLSDAIARAKKATVTVRVGMGHGSGFAIGDGSRVLTNAHVVGEAKTVTLITSGGASMSAQVAKVSVERDAALVDLGENRLLPLAVETAVPEPGSEVFAVGSPRLEELFGTVTRGIVSGLRDYDGLKWIQSDVATNPGNSGGPLIDEQGRVVGISTMGFTSGGGEIGLNLFIPIESALEFLGVAVE